MNDDLIEIELDLLQELEQRLRDAAASERISLNDYVCEVLSEQLAKYERDPSAPWLSTEPSRTGRSGSP
jgi:HicB family